MITRREFLKLAGIFAAMLTFKPYAAAMPETTGKSYPLKYPVAYAPETKRAFKCWLPVIKSG